MGLIFHESKKGIQGVTLPASDVPVEATPDRKYLREDSPPLPTVSEPAVVRHFTLLSRKNFSIDTNFYPLGSCTMKYNPKFTEKIASMEEFTDLHPLNAQIGRGSVFSQGALKMLRDLENMLGEITGMEAFTTQPMAGAHGELTGIMLMAAYHRENGQEKSHILIPDSGHGTNPASAAIAGYEVKTIRSDDKGVMNVDEFKKALNDKVAGVMLTCPNTLGVFNPHIKEISDLTHEAGGLMYYDGANLNAIMGKARPGDLGFDIVHLNLHKTFATPHGGGGPGAGPVGVNNKLAAFLPVPRIEDNGEGGYNLNYEKQLSIGYVSPFYGNFLVMLKAYAYILLLGKEGLISASENAVLNANYVKKGLRGHYDIPYYDCCLHEFVVSASRQAEKGVKAIDIAKALIDRGIHPPTVYFPLIVKEALMIEPTETESKDTLDEFIEHMKELAEMAERSAEVFKDMPVTTPVGRLDEVKAARDVDVCNLDG